MILPADHLQARYNVSLQRLEAKKLQERMAERSATVKRQQELAVQQHQHAMDERQQVVQVSNLLACRLA